jgi:molecular chaperone GrpE
MTERDAEPRTNGSNGAPDPVDEPRHGRGPSRNEMIAKIEELRDDLEHARAEADENLRSWQRSTADFSNYRRRVDEEREGTAAFANAILISKLLSVVDDFDRALATVPPDVHEGWLDGIRLVERKLHSTLEAEGVTPIEALGQPFDPNLHEAVVHEETTAHPDNQVIGELQRGYRLHDRVLRPALVRVANNPKES